MGKNVDRESGLMEKLGCLRVWADSFLMEMFSMVSGGFSGSKNHQKHSKTISNHQEPSRTIKNHQHLPLSLKPCRSNVVDHQEEVLKSLRKKQLQDWFTMAWYVWFTMNVLQLRNLQILGGNHGFSWWKLGMKWMNSNFGRKSRRVPLIEHAFGPLITCPWVGEPQKALVETVAGCFRTQQIWNQFFFWLTIGFNNPFLQDGPEFLVMCSLCIVFTVLYSFWEPILG